MQYLPYFLLALVLLFFLAQLWMARSARRLQGQPAPSLDFIADPEQRAQPRLLLYFYTPACSACRTMGPLIDALAADDPRVVKVNAAAEPDAARAFNILAVPTLVVVDAGRVERVQVGGVSEKRLASLLGSA